jgi:arylsulfatase A-like enzyme
MELPRLFGRRGYAADARPDHPSQARDSGRELHLFAGFIALAILLIAARLQTLRIAEQPNRWLLPVLAYQDVLAIAFAAWLFRGLFRLVRGTGGQRIIAIAGWGFAIAVAVYTAISEIVFWYIRSPLTYRLIVVSDDARGTGASVIEALSTAWRAIPAEVMLVVILAELLWRRAPVFVRRARNAFYSAPALAVLAIYLVGAHAWTDRYLRFAPAAENPEWAFVSSLFDAPRPVSADTIPAGYFEDFHAVPQPGGARDVTGFSPLLRVANGVRPMNVVLFVMESVGAKRLQLNGAPYDDSPVMMRLSRHAVVFSNAYVAQPFSSSAMAGLFTSLYPNHDWMTIPRKMPTIQVPGLPAVLKTHGYRTAFVHSGMIDYDGELEFLESHGFGDVIAQSSDDDEPRDAELVPAAVNWINHDRGKPFFLTIWTRDTHNPYLSPSSRHFTSDWLVDRYLNSVDWTDQVLGQLMDALERMGIADDTLVVITGDHGEALGEHGQAVHNFSVYNEEVRIPLMIVSRKIIPRKLTMDGIARQIDIAPTLLDLLGYDRPASWQGTSLFAAARPTRAYLFSSGGSFKLGLAEGDYVYVNEYSRNRQELYNVRNDPEESHDLSPDPAFAAIMSHAHLRLEAWLVFQNRYLDGFACSDCKTPRKASEPIGRLAQDDEKPPRNH